ncbi:MAG: PAS-domain containing protein [Dongiaceae bacterium]
MLTRGKLVWAICFALLLVSLPLLARDLSILRQGVVDSSGADFWYTSEIHRELLRFKVTLVEAKADWDESSAGRIRFQFDLAMSRLNNLPQQSNDGWHSQAFGRFPEFAALRDDVARFDAASSLLDTDPPSYLELALSGVEGVLKDSRALSVKALERQNGLIGYLQAEFEKFGIHLALYGAGLVALAVGLVYLMVRHMRSEGALRTADRGLVEKSALVEATLNSMSQGLCVVDTDWRLMAWNDHFLEQFEVAKGYARVGRPFADIIGNEAMGSGRGSEDALALLADWAERIGNSESHGFAYVRSNGRAIDIWGDPMPKGGYVYTFTDVTERRRAEQDIRESEERFRRLAEAVPQGIMVHFEGRILEANGNLGKLFGQPTDWLIGGDLRHLLTDDSWRSLTDQFERLEEGVAEIVGRRDDQSAGGTTNRPFPWRWRGGRSRTAAIRRRWSACSTSRRASSATSGCISRRSSRPSASSPAASPTTSTIC